MIAEGSYGCVYRRGPSECVVSGDNVIKVFENNADEEKEWQTSKVLVKIDPKNKYFIYSTHRCLTTYADIRRLNPSGNDCSLFPTDKEKQRERYVHYMPNAGVTIYRYFTNNRISFRQSKSIFADVCRCLLRLHRAGYYHNDVKQDNILIDSLNKPHLIDFGMMNSSDKYLSQSYKSVMRYLKSGYWYPPEYRWVFEKFPVTDDEKKVTELIDKEVSFISASIIKRYVYDGLKDFVSVNFEALESFSLRDRERYFDRVDVYSLGQMIAVACMDKISFENDRQFTFYTRLIRGMIHPDYKKRSSLRSVLKSLE